MAGNVQERRLRAIQSPRLALLLTVLTLCVFLTAITASINPILREELRSPLSLMMRSARWSAAWSQGTAHENLWMLSTDRQLYDGRDTNALFLMCKRLLLPLLLALQLLGLGGGLLTGHTWKHCAQRKVCARLISLTGTTLLAASVLVLFVFVESQLLGVTASPQQWHRALVWVLGLSSYFGISFSLAVWIASGVKGIRQASWILLSIFVGLLLLEGSRELFWPMTDAALPHVPELPTEVRLSLFRPSGEPRVTEDREEMVAEYLAAVDGYSTRLASAVDARYRAERLSNFVCPQLVLRELSFQLLQDDRATITEIIYSNARPYRVPSLRASLSAVKSEVIWLVAVFVLLSGGALRTQIKRRPRS